MDLTDIRMSARYPKGEGSPLLQRLCRKAWEPLFDPVLDEGTIEAIRIEALKTVLAASNDDELDVLQRYHATTMVSFFVIGVPNPKGLSRSTIRGELGCTIRVPSLHTRFNEAVIGSLMPEGTGDVVHDGLRVPDWIGSILQKRMEAWGGYEDEDAIITRVNRSTGSMSWRKILSAMPRTKEYVERLLEEGAAPIAKAA